VLLIDRTNSALTYVDPATCAVTRQIAVGTGFFSNPQDVLGLSATKAYVLRYEHNDKATPDPADLDDGDDILIVDPSQGRPTGRIGLGSFASAAGLPARPAHAALVNGKVYVALDSINSDFSMAGEGRLVIIDPASDTVTGSIDLPGRKGCNGLDPVPGTSTLVVTCAGVFSDGDKQVDASGIVFVDVGAATPGIISELPARLFGGRALSAVALTGPTTGLAVTAGSIQAMPPDQLWSWDVTAGTATAILAAKEGFALGAVLADPAGHTVYVSDATMDAPRVLVFDATAAPVQSSSLVPDPARGLPPRDLAWY
jgi:DNA-binding beta-propeller fold protein YncE